MFRIELSNPSDGYIIGEFHTAEITIIDDDRPSSIKLAEANVACSETNGTVDIQVLLKFNIFGNGNHVIKTSC
jgi:hypothetical protein